MNTLPPAPSFRSRQLGGVARTLLVLILIVVALPAAWTFFSLSWSYSEGERAGVLQKFSRKGYVCKTDEGELALYIVAGVAPQIWEFTVRDPAVAADLYHYVGRRVQLHYSEHKGVPSSCFGDTSYFVDRVTPVDVPAAPAAAAAPTAPGAPAAPAAPAAP
jgi:hypothetical protein